MATLDLRLLIDMAATLTSSLDLTTVSAPLDYSQQINITNGTGAGQANMVFSDERTVSASATDSLDLAGSLTDPFGATMTFARIKAVLVKAAATNTNNVNVVMPASNGVPLFLAASDGIAVQPGGLLLWVAPTAAGVVVTAGTGDLLNLVNSAGGSSVTYQIVIVGANA